MKEYRKYLDPETLSRLGGLEVRARHVVEGYLSGLHRSPFRGRSVEFAEHRPYTPGVELKHVDWKLWARSDRFFVKLYEQETNVRAYLLLDASGSMGYGSGPMTKYDYGATIVASLACLLLAQQDAVGLVVFDSRIRDELPPSASEVRLQDLCRVLESHTPGGETDLGRLIHLIAERLPRRSMVILVSDMLAPLGATISALERLRYDGHAAIVVQVTDPDEEEFPFEGNVRFEGLESDVALPAEARRLRRAYLRAFEADRRALEAACGREKIDYAKARTDEPPSTVLGRLLLGAAQRF